MRNAFAVLRPLLALLMLVGVAPLAAADMQITAEEQDWLDAHQSIKVATFSPGWFPFERLGEDGNLEGVGPEYLRLVAEQLHLKIVPTQYDSWPDALRAACRGEVDILMNVAIVPDRTSCLVFTAPYINAPNVVIGPSTLAPLPEDRIATSRVAVEAGFAAASGIANRYPTAQQVMVPTVQDALEAVVDKRADLYIGNLQVAAELLRRPAFRNLAVLRSAGLPTSSLHFAVTDEKKPLARLISKALATLNDEDHARIRGKWLDLSLSQEYLANRVALSQNERQWLQQLPVLKIGFNANWDAVSPAGNGGALSGISGDFARVIESRLGLRLAPQPARSMRDLTGLMRNRKVDIAVVTSNTSGDDAWLYTDPIVSLANVVVGRLDSPPISGAADLNRTKVGTVGLRRKGLILQSAPSADVVLVDGMDRGLDLVRSGILDMYVGDVISVSRSIRERGLPLRVLSPAGFDDDVTFAVSRDHGELVSLINRTMAGISDDERQRVRMGWLEVDLHYGVDWKNVLIGIVLAAGLLGSFAFAYFRIRREIARREQTDALLRGLTRNLPGVVFKIAVAADKTMTAPFVAGNTEGLFGMTATVCMEDLPTLLRRFRSHDRGRIVSLLTSDEPVPIELDAPIDSTWIRLSAAPRRLSQGGVNWSGYCADVTREHAQLDALAESKASAEVAANARATFLATMSHEIRTPMSGLSGLLELLTRTELTPEQRRLLDRANASATSLRTLLDDVLDYARIDAGRMDVAKGDLPLRDVVCDAILLMAGAASQKGIGCECHIDPRLAGLLEGDATRVGQIVVNLLSNAIKFTEVGCVTVRLTMLGSGDGWQSWELAVTDTGIGMTASERERLFQPFAQAHAATAGQFGGSGLGLVISQRLATLMGGKLLLESKWGQGTTARLILQSTVIEADARDPALDGCRTFVQCEDAVLGRTVQEYLATLGARFVESVQAAALIITDNEAGVAVDAPTVRLIQASPLASLGAQGIAVGVRPPLFTLVRDACKDALLAGAPVVPQESVTSLGADSVGSDAPYVLVAEDDPTNQVLISGQLSELGCRSLVVADGMAALQACERQDFDLLITDVHMPRLDGLGLASEIRRRERDNDLDRLPIVALTARAFNEDIERCLAAGMDDHVAKPASLRDLYRCLRRWIALPLKYPDGSERAVAIENHPTLVRAARAFMDDAPRLQADLRGALLRNDGPHLAQLLHKASGAVAVLGHTPLSRLIGQTLSQLESDGLEPHQEDIAKVLQRLDDCVGEIARMVPSRS